MEVKFAELLNSYGVSADETTNKIREGVKEFNSSWDEYNVIIQSYNSSEDEEEKQVLLDEIKTFEQDLKEADDMLCKKIESWNRNKDRWAQKAEHMREINEKKKQARESGVQSAPEVAPPQVTVAEPQPQMVEQGTLVAEEESSSGGWGGWILGLGLAVITLGVASKYFKNQ